MLQIKNICKEYRTGDLVQKALDHVSLNLRDNEFVAILGPSGSGKTTLLNIIGGLDRYDSGDLVINGISTKKYKDADWDSYRNHTIGFVFQSYNLIPHQTVLANVELALTISGISRSERKKKAVAALEAVGLGNQLHKKPNQMSGGQMQRVALARALVNDPDILLADEPTGALDSETSIQVMDLLKEVARDRLVVMVTHNPELAHMYANRIVSVKDGHILSDSNPYEVKESDEPLKHKNMGKSSMSFLTALSLSFNNLLTKKARTILVSFAGSIGIIGIALILSLSTGVNAYIQKTEQEALSEYPLQITKNAMSLSSMMETPEKKKNDKNGEVTEVDTVSSMLGTMSENDLASFRKYLESGKSGIEKYTRSVEYTYDVDPLLYLEEDNGKIHQVNPSTAMSSSGLMPTASVYASSMMPSVVSQLPASSSLYRNSYEVKAGRWPSSYNEAVLVISERGTVTDLTLYTLGMKDYSEFENMISALSSGNTSQETEVSSKGSYSYEDFIGKKLKIVNAADCYEKDDSLNLYTDMREDADYMKKVLSESEDLSIVGVVQAKESDKVNVLSTGINYEPSLVEHIVSMAKESQIVKDQIADPKRNVLTGEAFGNEENSSFSMADLFTVDTDAIAKAFAFDPSAIRLENVSIDADSLGSAMNISLSDAEVSAIMKNVKIDTSKLDVKQILQDVVNDFVTKNPEMTRQSQRMKDYLSSDEARSILEKEINDLIQNKKDPEAYQQAFRKVMDAYMKSSLYDPSDPLKNLNEYLSSSEGQQIIQETMNEMDLKITDEDVNAILRALWDGFENYEKEQYGEIDTKAIQEAFDTYLKNDSYKQILMNDVMEMLNVKQVAADVISSASEIYGKKITAGMSAVMTSLQNSIVNSFSEGMAKAFSFNPSALQNAFHMNMDEDKIRNLFSSTISNTSSTYEKNLSSFGYADLEDPSSIVIYPTDFEAKNQVKDIIDSYNKSVVEKGQKDREIVYVDAVATLMSSVTDIVNTISYVLIAFVAISLVVSSIMIGIITYISVLERQKEIGILRAIGASKRNISNVFNAETFITGLLAGCIGVGISLILLIPGNQLIHHFAGNSQVNAYLSVSNALILIALSVILTMIGGVIPARKAAKSDPVKALRTD